MDKDFEVDLLIIFINFNYKLGVCFIINNSSV